MKLENVVCQNWDESEQGWGVRPDGCSLHLTIEDCKKYILEYWNRMPKNHVPHEYSRPGGKPFEAKVSQDVYKKIQKNKGSTYGLRLFDYEMNELEEKKKIKIPEYDERKELDIPCEESERKFFEF